jgi:hypothetical protein
VTSLGQILAGSTITADEVAGVAPLAVIKPADETVTSSVVLQADNNLLLNLADYPNSTWLFECFLVYSGGTQGSSDIQWQWSVPSGATLLYTDDNMTTSGNPSTGTLWTASSNPTAGTNGGTGNLCGLTMKGTLQIGTTAGTLQLLWAQNHSSSTATTVKAGSSLQLWQVS